MYQYYCQQYKTTIRPAVQMALSQDMGNYEGVDSINVHFNICNRGILPLLEVLRHCQQCNEFDVSNCHLAGPEVEWLCEAASSHPTLHTIDLSGNSSLTDEHGLRLAQLADSNPRIKEIRMDKTGINDPGLLSHIDTILTRNKRMAGLRHRHSSMNIGANGSRPPSAARGGSSLVPQQ
jgi:hypothetical protein